MRAIYDFLTSYYQGKKACKVDTDMNTSNSYKKNKHTYVKHEVFYERKNQTKATPCLHLTQLKY
jgi:hypothetical protein